METRVQGWTLRCPTLEGELILSFRKAAVQLECLCAKNVTIRLYNVC